MSQTQDRDEEEEEDNTDPFVQDIGPLLGQPPVEQCSPGLLGGLVHSKILADHDGKNVSEITGHQSPCVSIFIVYFISIFRIMMLLFFFLREPEKLTVYSRISQHFIPFSTRNFGVLEP